MKNKDKTSFPNSLAKSNLSGWYRQSFHEDFSKSSLLTSKYWNFRVRYNPLRMGFLSVLIRDKKEFNYLFSFFIFVHITIQSMKDNFPMRLAHKTLKSDVWNSRRDIDYILENTHVIWFRKFPRIIRPGYGGFGGNDFWVWFFFFFKSVCN